MSDFTIRANGISLCVTRFGGAQTPSEGPGDGSAPPILFLHGFSGCAEGWRIVADRLKAALGPRRILLGLDLIGHGRSASPEEATRYSMEATVGDIEALLDHLGIPKVDLIGYSMGGRVALHVAAARPERVARLVLESATPGIASPAEREARRTQDRDLADWIIQHGICAFADRWESLPLFESQKRLPEEIRERQRRLRLANDPIGLANSLRGMGTGVQRPLWDDLERIECETLLMVGALDEKFVDIGRRMRERMPRARLIQAAECGHNVHLERPEFYAGTVAAFLARPVQTSHLRKG